MATEFEKELIKLYEKLKDSPEKYGIEKGIVELEDETTMAKSFDPAPKDWLEARKNEQETYEQSDQEYVIDLYKQYGFGPKSINVEQGSYAGDKKEPPPVRWYHETKTHLSKDGKYYIVPVVYERMTSNPALQSFFKNGKLQISDGAVGILGTSTNAIAFVDSAKAWALEKLAADLSKALSTQNRDDAKKVAFLPADSKSALSRNQLAAEAWYVEHRPEEFQNLFLKMMFDRNWVDSLSPKCTPCADTSDIKHTVMLFVKTLEKDLVDLQAILYRFQARILETTVSVDFDAACTADKISQISELFNKLLRLNDKPEISERSPAAFQVAFDNEYKIQYIAYSELPDCLCDEENMNAYILKKGVENLKSTPPFDSSTVNAFLYYMPDIIRKYSPYLKGAKSEYLFAAEESWVRFIKSYVFPLPEVVFDAPSTDAELFMEKIEAFGKLSSASTSLIKKAAYTRDPTILLAPEQRALLHGIAQGQSVYAGDDVMMDAIKSQIFSMTTLYDRLLNRVPVLELVKIGVSAIIRCTGDSALKRKLCRALLKAMPRVDVETKLIPCLQSEGETAAANKLSLTFGARLEQTYSAAKARYPDKFTKSAAEAIQSEAEMSKVNGLYCADPAFQEMLGRPIDDFSEEMLLWLEQNGNDAICECILNVYGPVQQLLDFVENLKDDADDIFDIFGQNKAQQIETTTTYSFKNTFAPFKAFVSNESGNFGNALVSVLFDIYFKILLGAVLVILNHVKSEYIGGLLRDACNVTANPFSKKSITDLIKNSPLYKDKSFQQIKKTIKDMASMAGLAGEIQDIMSALDKLGEQFTASEFQRLFTTPCNDNSFEDGFRKARATFTATGITQTGAFIDAGGTPTDAALAFKEGDDVTIPPLCPAPKTTAPSISSVQTFLADVGNMATTAMFDDIVLEWDEIKDQLVNLCDPEAPDILAIDPEDLLKLAEKDKGDLTDDIVDILPLLDPSKIEDMMPPIFCGPCKPSQIGMAPLMPRQSHPSELIMFENANKDLYGSLNKTFNDNLEGYKPIMLGVGNLMKEVMGAFKSNIPPSIGRDTKMNLGVVDLPIGSFTRDREEALKGFAAAAEALHDKSKGEVKLVASGLAHAIESATSTNIIVPEDIDEFVAFKYFVPDSQTVIAMMINYSDNAINFSVEGKTIKTQSQQIKIVAIDTALNIIKFEWPGQPASANMADPIVFSDADLVETLTNILMKIPGFSFSADNDKQVESFKNQFPVMTNLIFENIFKHGTRHDLFKAPVFNKIPLTDAEMLASCAEGVGRIPLLNIEKLSEDVNQARQALECVVSAFAQPSVEQIANIYGSYKILMKVCIIEEYLKNIFIFGFLRVSDVTRNEGYMQLVQDNIVNSVNAVAGQNGYDNLLDYSSKIINGRQQLGEVFPTDPGKEFQILTPEASFRILIAEAAEEVDDILDARIQGIVDPGWTKKFYSIDGLEGEEAQIAVMGRILEYAIHSPPEYWSPDLFPAWVHPDEAKKLDNLNAMREIDPSDHPSNNGLDWPMASAAGGDWEGGLFFQPYMRIKSKITGIRDFYNKFLEAEAETKYVWDAWTSTQQLNLLKSYQPPVPLPVIDVINGAIDTLITRITDHIAEGKNPHTDSDIKAFFDLVFKPETSADGRKLPFMRVVSSFQPPGKLGTAYDTYYYWPMGNASNSKNTPTIHGAQDDQRWHWANRGVVSTHRAGRIYEQGVDWRVQPPHGDSRTGEAFVAKKLYESTPATLGAVKEINYADWDVTDPLYTGTQNVLNRFAAGIEWSTTSEEDASGNTTTTQHPEYVQAFWNKIRNIIFDSSFSKWFDIKFGMRLNLLTPMEDVDSGFFESVYNAVDPDDLAGYNDEKTFIWERPDGLGKKQYFCFPIEQVEHDITKFAPVINSFNGLRLSEDKNPALGATALLREKWTLVNVITGEMESEMVMDPTLWALASSIDKGFFNESEAILNALKISLAKKVAYGNNPAIPQPNKLLVNIVPVKELLMASALFYRYYMEEAYPSLNTLFDPTKSAITSIIAAMDAASKGDYSYLDDLLENQDLGESSAAQTPTDAQLAKKFMLLFVQMAANMFDPTWQTPWFLPGPLTPIGIVAKALLTDWSDDKDKDDEGDDITEPKEKICPPEISLDAPEPSLVEEGIVFTAEEILAGQADIEPAMERWLLVFPEAEHNRYHGDDNWMSIEGEALHHMQFAGAKEAYMLEQWKKNIISGVHKATMQDIMTETKFGQLGLWGAYYRSYGYSGTYLKLNDPSDTELTGVVVTPSVKLANTKLEAENIFNLASNPAEALQLPNPYTNLVSTFTAPKETNWINASMMPGPFVEDDPNAPAGFGKMMESGYTPIFGGVPLEAVKYFRDLVYTTLLWNRFNANFNPERWIHSDGPAIAVTLSKNNPFPLPFVQYAFNGQEGEDAYIEKLSQIDVSKEGGPHNVDAIGGDVLEYLNVTKLSPNTWEEKPDVSRDFSPLFGIASAGPVIID